MRRRSLLAAGLTASLACPTVLRAQGATVPKGLVLFTGIKRT